MAFWAHADVLDNGPNYIKTNCDTWACIAAYTANDSYATVTGGSNVLSSVAMTSTDFTLSGASGAARVLTVASGKSDSSANNTGVSAHFAFLDSVNSKVLWITTESSGQTVTALNPVNYPSGLTYTSNQPTA